MSNEAAERLRDRIRAFPSILVIEELLGLLDEAEARATRSPECECGWDEADDAPHHPRCSRRAASPLAALDELRPFLIHAVDMAIINALAEYARLSEGTDR